MTRTDLIALELGRVNDRLRADTLEEHAAKERAKQRRSVMWMLAVGILIGIIITVIIFTALMASTMPQ